MYHQYCIILSLYCTWPWILTRNYEQCNKYKLSTFLSTVPHWFGTREQCGWISTSYHLIYKIDRHSRFESVIIESNKRSYMPQIESAMQMACRWVTTCMITIPIKHYYFLQIFRWLIEDGRVSVNLQVFMRARLQLYLEIANSNVHFVTCT